MNLTTGYIGRLYDSLTDTEVERSPVIRATREQAEADARRLIDVVNELAEDADDDTDGWTVGRVDESYIDVVEVTA